VSGDDLLALRVSDTDRERAVASLREHLSAGRLTLDEFTERVEEAYAARTSAELERVGRELPAAAPARARRGRKWLTLSVFSHIVRRGRWRVPKLALVVSFFGDIDLDLREAEADGPQATILVLTHFGNVDVFVPEAVEVDTTGIAIFGHSRDWGSELPPTPGTPLLRVWSLGLFGTTDVWRVPRGATGSYRELVRSVRSGRRELNP
jgi:Domain of unknown function (DUF1707)/Cell wall-active antibiotics response 4TMS YvqF